MTTQGVCRGLPLENLTHENVSVETSDKGTGIFIESGGFHRYVAVTENPGNARNAYN